MTTALVLSGGGNLGAAQAGMLLAMEEAGVELDFIVGTSAGALNGAWVAGRRPATDLADVWRGLRRSDIFPTSLVGGLLGFVGVRDHLASGHGLRAILNRYVNFDLIEDAPTPFRVIATDVMTGTDVCLDSGPAVDAVMASAAIPGVFAPVEIDGRTLIDGGVVNNAPISHAVALGADRVWVLTTGYACSLAKPPRSALGMALQAFTLAIQERLCLDVERYSGQIDLRVVPPLCPISVAPTDFSQASALIEQAYAHASAWFYEVGRFPSVEAARPPRHVH